MGTQMSEKAVERHEVVSLINAKAIKMSEGAKRLGITPRQMRRIRRRHAQEGVSGLNSKHFGQKPGNAIDEATRQEILSLLESRYQGFGPTLLVEKLRQTHGIALSTESARQMMISAGHWRAKRGVEIKRHPLRPRRARFGELIQIDGSPHDWFEGRSARCTLLVMIDDATGRLTQLHFAPTETTLGYMHSLFAHIQSHGLPMALYSDKHSIFRDNSPAEGQTQLGRALEHLGIELICANSPQAKGRVERVNQTLQDRLVKEMRLQGIDGIDAANAWLPHYMETFNDRFAVVPADPDDAHAVYADSEDALRTVLSEHEERTLSKELTISYQRRCLQLEHTGSGRGMRGAKVTVHRHFDGTLDIRRQGRSLPWREIERPQKSSAGTVIGSKDIDRHLDALMSVRQVHKPAANHPWRGGARREEASLRTSPSITLPLAVRSKTTSKPTTKPTATSL